jgi:hypothetical protein
MEFVGAKENCNDVEADVIDMQPRCSADGY